MVKLKDLAGGSLELIKPIECFWKPHVAIQVDDLYQAGSLFHVKREAKEDNSVAVQYVQDPWGNWIELVEVKE